MYMESILARIPHRSFIWITKLLSWLLDSLAFQTQQSVRILYVSVAAGFGRHRIQIVWPVKVRLRALVVSNPAVQQDPAVFDKRLRKFDAMLIGVDHRLRLGGQYTGHT